MKRPIPLAAALGILVALPVSAQETPPQIVFATYYRCDQGREARADTLMERTFAPLFDRHVQAGRLSAWGWWMHRMGTEWRRLLYMTGSDRDALFDARGQIVQELGQRHARAAQELGSICPSHDDYIWTFLVNNAGAGPAPMTLSSYFVCDYSRQEVADLLMTQSLAPIFDRHVERGTIASWGWLAHRMGGTVRRILTMGGPDAKSLLNGQDAIFADVEAEAAVASREFDTICGTHDDYLWAHGIDRP